MEPNQLETLSKKERIELRQEERNKLEETREKSRIKKRIIHWTIGILSTALFIYGVVLLVHTSSVPELGQSFPNQGQEHIAIGASHVAYNSNPPTSGPHYAQPANWGIYQNELPDEQLIHNLEHGGIWISYTGVATSTISEIEDLAKRYSNKMIVTPRTKDDTPIVLASWTRLEKFDTFDEAKIVEFIKANKNKSPEPLAQ